jgi:AraC family transcriptional regulator
MSFTNHPFSYDLKADWNGIQVEYTRSDVTGEYDVSFPKHIVGVALALQDRVTWRIDSGATSQTSPLVPGSIFLYSDSDFLWLDRSHPCECVHMTLDPALLRRVTTDCALSNNVEIDCRVMFADPTILNLAQLFKAEILNGGFAGQLYTESLANVLAVHLLRNYSGIVSKHLLQNDAIDDFKLAQVKDFIEAHLAEDLTIAQLAAVVHLSQFHFARAFKAATGQPPHRYVRRQRIERAKILLSVTRLSVCEVADRVGFSNQSHFTAQFRRLTGVTPKAYRDNF